ncbi:uncharacterized protein LOC126995103 [Eriocheir sinensis]|uniref:uncharacterized protein LOC126995103 n=1 Tax=Eriocheir sinensis TaxID=95602 RepID=UPI0021C77885|nr:uncharacterized protein LOC126995103 [Eriocheir sinensis]
MTSRHTLSGGTARHFLKKALLPLTGWCDSVGSLLLLEVRCPNLTTTLTTALSVVVEDRGRVEATADYSCEKGRRIVGNSQRKCGSNGIWSGSQPRCEYVTCDLPQGLDNGRIVRLNQTLEYGSLVEYHCLPEHRLVGGSFRRSCGELGEWLGGEPKCVLGPEDAYNTIGSDSSSSSSVSTTSTSTTSNTGLYIGLFFGLILAIVFIGMLVYFRIHPRPRPSPSPDRQPAPRLPPWPPAGLEVARLPTVLPLAVPGQCHTCKLQRHARSGGAAGLLLPLTHAGLLLLLLLLSVSFYHIHPCHNTTTTAAEMDFESPHVEKEFPGLYASESSRRSNSNWSCRSQC